MGALGCLLTKLVRFLGCSRNDLDELNDTMYLARRIAAAKWEKKKEFADDEVPADTVTRDLKTSENTLSFWGFELPSENLVDECTLAIASTWDRLDSIDVLWLEKRRLEQSNLPIVDTLGDTPVEDLRRRHRDVAHLDLKRLTQTAILVAEAFREEMNHKRLTKSEVKSLLVAAIRSKRLDISALRPKIKEELERSLLGAS